MAEPIMKYNGLLGNLHFRKVLKQAVKIASLNGDETVLDFGCEEHFLQRELPKGVKYVGYDIVPRFCTVNDYTKLNGIDVVFALNVLEHVTSEEELEKVLLNFKKIGAKKLVVAIPNEGAWDSMLRFIFNWDARNFFHHALETKQIAKVLLKTWGPPEAYKRYHTVQYLARYERK